MAITATMVRMAQPSEDSTSGNSASRKKSLPVIVGGTLLVLVAGYFGIDLSSSGSGDSGSTNTEVSADSDTCAMSSLPAEAAETRVDILAACPYASPYNHNRQFGMYEGILPGQDSDLYRESAVETPGLDHRGQNPFIIAEVAIVIIRIVI